MEMLEQHTYFKFNKQSLFFVFFSFLQIWKAVQHDVTVLTVMMDDQERAEREEYATFVEADRKDEL